ncbi:hypothetical protein Lepto7376_4124 [[Leptolyngbya] sp. PCC 7376]|uniref:DUF2281 domain-containing protein n=1 Tax=[Leptolyngbya] sp. PCC 7376 TaxID=111781 RepID=UPI00029F0573|nr:DUF2281 domain-containing protein [[Leptolyngbya] sp. PCC 7376]AFY40253.1 hypothetical protein Lepto7376_4124 [[Leptolyngbya] sp. PCC 7376]
MQPKEQIIKEIENLPEPLQREALDFILFLKARYSESEVPVEDKKRTLASPKVFAVEATQPSQEQTEPNPAPSKPIRPHKQGKPKGLIVVPNNPRQNFQDYMD